MSIFNRIVDSDYAVPIGGILVVLFLFGAMVAVIEYETSHPCLKRGPRELSHYYKVGQILVPVYHEPCIERGERK